jgi:hypothetical protein
MRRTLWLALAISPLLMASQCFRVARVQVSPGAAPGDPPSFGFAYRGQPLTGVQSFRVESCSADGQGPLWQIARVDETLTETEPLRITYGQVPRGFRERRPAEPLQAGGCYHASARGMEEVQLSRMIISGESFYLLSNRRMIVGSPAGLLHNPRPFRQINRAAAGCHRGYRRARTQEDSAAVDARRYRVLDDSPSCEWLNTHWPDLMSEPASTERTALTLTGRLVLYVTLGLLAEQIPEWPQ